MFTAGGYRLRALLSRRNRLLLLLVMPLLLQVALAQEAAVKETDQAAESGAVEAAEPASEQAEVSPARLSWDVRIDRMVAARTTYDENAEDPDELFDELGQLLRVRARQFDLMVDDAGSRSNPADSHLEVLSAVFPAFDPEMLVLPEYVVTVQDAHENFLGLYLQHIRLLGYVSDDLRKEITSTDLYGMQQLYFEFDAILLELRYQVLRVPDAGEQIMRMARRAPLPLVWFVIQLILLLAIFRWWRRWFPETLTRMQSSLRSIRPRTSEIVRRMRALWCMQQVRSPVEWLILSYGLIGLFAFLDLIYISAMTRIIVTWIFLSWFAVEFLDALVARGSGGLTSDTGRTRQRSLRWLAGWLVLLGLGLTLAERLAGEAALYTLVWRVVQVMAFPLLILQLGLWREYLFRRAEIEDPAFMPREDLDRQRGPVKIFAAAKLCGFLIATTLRKRLLRSLEQFGSPRAAKLVAEAGWQKDMRGIHPVDPALHDLLLAGSTDYTKYARENRRQLVERVKNNVGGTVVVIGERGIGKGGFMRQVCEAAAVNYVTIDCQSGSATAMEAELAAALDLTVPLDNRVILAEAFERKQVQVIAILNLHMLVRPVVGGFNEFNRMSAIMDLLPTGVMHLMGMDRYAWFYVKAALAERSASVDRIELQEWSEEHIRELIVRRCEEAGIKVDFTRVRVPSEYLDGEASTLEERNRIGVTLMCAVLAGGNPSIAMRLFVRCLRADDAGRLFATLPANLDAGQLDGASLHLLLLLRVVAQAERITEAQLHDNLRYPVGVIQNALQLAITREWIVEDEGHYSLSWQWFRTITRVLARHNLLAGVRQEV